MKRLQLQGSRKLGCQAYIKVRYYTVYSNCQVCDAALMTKRQLRDLKEERLSQLRKEIAVGRAAVEEYCFIVLPTENAHSGHPTGEISGYSQRVHPLVIAKISELVASGITNIHELRKILQHYVQHDRSVATLNPSTTDRAFYPMLCDIKNHVCKAKKAFELSKLDQENLRLKMEDWKQSSPLSNFYFRPYIKDASNAKIDAGITNTDAGNTNTDAGNANTDADNTNTDAGNANTDTGNANIDTGTRNSKGHKTFVGNSGGDDDDYDCELIGTTDVCTQSFLWIHQEKWQRDLLVKFGNTITLLDAT